MIAWDDYLKKLVSEPDEMDGITLSFNGGDTNISVPAIVKSSILMLDKMVQHQGKRHVIVFPEREQTALIFSLISAIHNIETGKIEKRYLVENFVPGDKLKIGNAVVQFLGVSEMYDKKYMHIHMSDTDKYSFPVETAPVFQKTDTKRPLSSWKKFYKERKALEKNNQIISESGSYLSRLIQYKTHMSASVYYVSAVSGVKEQLIDMRFCNEKLSHYILLGQTNYEGNITNLGTGQMAGIPAVVFSSDLYAVSAAVENGNPIQSLIVDISNMNQILSQLDALDEILTTGIPVIFVTDTANSFDLGELLSRKFNVWRWDKSSITKDLYSTQKTETEITIEHCAKQRLHYIKVAGNEISESARILAKYRRRTQEQSVQIMDMYGKLSNISFNILRETVPISDGEAQNVDQILDECQNLLDHERDYLSSEEYSDYGKVIENYRRIFEYGYKINKHNALRDTITEHRGKRICLVIPEKGNKEKTEKFWKNEIEDKNTILEILYPSECYAASNIKYDVTIIVGWLKRAIMRKLIFSYRTLSYVVLLYDYENRWKNHDAKNWKAALKDSDNKITIENSFSSSDIVVSSSSYRVEDDEIIPVEETATDDELEEIDSILRENKFRRYVKSGQRSESEIVDAVPVNFVGGYIAFYQTGHEVVTATNIIIQESEKIDTLTPDKLRNGDFVIVRETDKDIIREMADLILQKSGKIELRELAGKWKEVIKIELLFTTPKQFYESLVAVGFTKGYPTVKRWIENDGVIAPGQIEDLEYIAKVTQNQVLSELMEEIFEAARIVRAAHIQAGRTLSDMLKVKLAEELKKYGKIDPFNFWEPIEINVEGIGTVKILKIIDIGSMVQVDSSDTNRLIEE